MSKTDGGLRGLFRLYLPRVAWSTIETGSVEPGVADLNGVIDGVEFWVENKKCEANAVEVKPSQVAWHRLRHYRRGRTFFAVRQMTVHDEDNLYLISGREAEQLKEMGLRGCTVLLKTEGGPTRWDWKKVLRVLTTRHEVK
jgi:hypothetical protein